MRKYAQDTTVPVSKSREEISALLQQWGCDGVQWSDGFSDGRVTLRFRWSRANPAGIESYVARISVQLPTRDQLAKSPQVKDGRTGHVSDKKLAEAIQKLGRSEHRLILLWLKAAFNAVDAGIIEASAIFLPFLEGKDGVTVHERVAPQLEAFASGLLLPSGA